MFPWLLLLIVPVICELLRKSYVRVGKARYNISFLVTYICLFVFRAFRSDAVGGDLAMYKNAFNYFEDKTWSSLSLINLSGYETGYVVYNKLLHFISNDFQIVLIVTALITTYALLKFIFENSKHPGYSLFIYIAMYFYGASFNNERQAIAIALLFLSFSYVKRRELVNFLIMVFMATLFHTTSIIFLVLYPLYNVKLSTKYWVIFVLSMVMAFVANQYIISMLITRVYANKYGDSDLMEGGGYGYFGLLLLLMFVYVVSTTKRKKEIPQDRIWIHMMAVATVLQVFSFAMGYFYRAVVLFSVAMIIILPEITCGFKDRATRSICTLLVIVVLLFRYISSLSNDGLELVPYTSILF